jgi:hypothetical protein
MSLKEYFIELGLEKTNDLREALRTNKRNASGRTSESIDFAVSEDRDKVVFEITANKVLRVLESGRGPTVNDGPGRVREGIKQWIKDKGIKSNIPEQSLIFLITRKIHREGYKGTPGLITDTINDELVREIQERVAELETNEFVKELQKVVK